MLFRKKLFKRSSNQYLPSQQADDLSMPKLGKGKKNKTIQVLKMCHTVKSAGGCVRQRVFHGPDQRHLRQKNETISADQPKPTHEICALKKAKLACLEKNNVTLPKTCAQLYVERTEKRIRSQQFQNSQSVHPAFQSTLFSGASKKENMNKNERNRRFGEFNLHKIRSLTTLQSIQECEDEHLYES